MNFSDNALKVVGLSKRQSKCSPDSLFGVSSCFGLPSLGGRMCPITEKDGKVEHVKVYLHLFPFFLFAHINCTKD